MSLSHLRKMKIRNGKERKKRIENEKERLKKFQRDIRNYS